MSALPKTDAPVTVMTIAEYLAFERDSPIKHEYIDGQVYAMSGGSSNHSLIAFATGFALFPQLRSRGCIIYNSDMKVQIGSSKLFTYPDVTIVCGIPEFADTDEHTLLNPTVIVEVLSPSTEAYDRGEKFDRYKALDSLQNYILIAQDHVEIECFTRQPDHEWQSVTFNNQSQVIDLRSVGCQLSVAEVYAQVTFDESS